MRKFWAFFSLWSICIISEITLSLIHVQIACHAVLLYNKHKVNNLHSISYFSLDFRIHDSDLFKMDFSICGPKNSTGTTSFFLIVIFLVTVPLIFLFL